MRWIPSLLTYLAFGFVFHVIFYAPRIDPYDAWSWAWILGWWIIIGMWIMKWFLILLAVLLLIAGVVAWRESRR